MPANLPSWYKPLTVGLFAAPLLLLSSLVVQEQFLPPGLACHDEKSASEDAVTFQGLGSLGTSTYVTTSLGTLNVDNLEQDAVRFANEFAQKHLSANGDEAFSVRQVVRKNCLEGIHIRLDLNTARVSATGSDIVIHANDRGSIYAVNGDFIAGNSWMSKTDISFAKASRQPAKRWEFTTVAYSTSRLRRQARLSSLGELN